MKNMNNEKVKLTDDMRDVLCVTIDICDEMESRKEAGKTSRWIRSLCKNMLDADPIPFNLLIVIWSMAHDMIAQCLFWSVVISPDNPMYSFTQYVSGYFWTCVRVKEDVKRIMASSEYGRQLWNALSVEKI